jgi:formiminotetrahydrofolate cyclodeaminase
MTALTDFLSDLASDAPTPGGGSVAALAGALGAALTSMVANLTLGRKKYADVEPDIKALLAKTEALRLELTELMGEDAAAFDKVMAAMKLPKDTEEEKARRTEALEAALTDAAMVPLAVMEKCVAVLGFAGEAAEKGNRNAVSDAGVAALMARAGAHAAKLNVLINLGWIKSEKHRGFVEKAGRAIEDLADEADRSAERVLEVVLQKL